MILNRLKFQAWAINVKFTFLMESFASHHFRVINKLVAYLPEGLQQFISLVQNCAVSRRIEGVIHHYERVFPADFFRSHLTISKKGNMLKQQV